MLKEYSKVFVAEGQGNPVGLIVVCLLRSDQFNNIQQDQVKSENTVKLRTRMIEIIRQNIKFNQNELKFK